MLALRQLYNFHKTAIRQRTAENKSLANDFLAEGIVELVAMAMALIDKLGVIGLAGQRIRINLARIQTKAHRAAHVLDIKLLRHEVDNRMRAVRIELGAVGISHTADVTRKLDNSALHSQADTEERQLMLTCILNSLNLALDAAVAEAARYEHAVYAGHNLVHIGIICFDFLGVNPFDSQLSLIRNCCVTQRFRDRDIGILQRNIFADNGNGYFFIIFFQDAGHHIMPTAHILRLVLHVQLAQNNAVQSLLLHEHRHLIDASGRKVLDNCVRVNVAEHSHFFTHFLRNRLFTAADDDIRRNTDAAQLLNAVLRRLGLQLARCRNVRHQRNMDIQDIIFANILFNLTNRLQEGQAFNIAYCATDFRDNEISIILLADAENALLDFIGNVRNNLHRTAQIITTAFFIYYTLVNLTCSGIGILRQVDINKAFIMSQIQICFCTVISNEHLAVLIRTHRPRVNIDIRVELLDGDSVATTLKQAS